jgi:hypothetical protein
MPALLFEDQGCSEEVHQVHLRPEQLRTAHMRIGLLANQNIVGVDDRLIG